MNGHDEGIEEKQRIEKEAEEFIHKNVFGNEKYVTTVSPKGCYIAGATAENNRLREQLAKERKRIFYLEELRDSLKSEFAKELREERDLRKELVEGLESVIRLRPLIEYTGMPEEKHIGEAMAISGMLSKVEALIKKGT